MADAPVLETQSVDKSFGPLEALKDVSLRVYAGRVHTLLGENGAGKSTLMKILAGVYAPAHGRILLDGAETVFANPAAARRKGIAIVYQELSLANNLTVAENIFANHLPQRCGVVNRSRLMIEARRVLGALGIAIDPASPVSSLPMAQRQLVEIAKALSRPSRVVIMDEPTSSLGHHEAQALFGILERLKAQGQAVIYISHRMDEIMRISDDISVMRDGRLLCTLRKQDTTIDALITLMVGREMRDIYPPRRISPAGQGPPLLVVKGLSAPGRFHGIDFTVHAGEVLGVFGLVGAGRSEVMKALFGMVRTGGEILIDGQVARLASPAAAIARGIAFVTENRKEEGLVLAHSVARNINMVYFQRGGARFGLVDTRALARRAREAAARMSIRITSPEQAVGNLSGGNQQKIVFAKWLGLSPRLLILDEPTRGIDVGARYEIYGMIRELAAAGTAIILVSSDLPEVLAMSDRLLVMRDRRIVKELGAEGLSQEEVISYATGAFSA
jgi:ribose transport system ATP-binding protein